LGGKRSSLVILALTAGCAWPSAAAFAEPSLVDLSLEELANLEITSVSRRPEPLSQAPASIFVITGEDIRRSGVHTLPEALRLAPNLNVARINASQYAISARGFNNTVGNKLLVLIDGRTVYTPLFSGVFWDHQEVLLEDVERIEVISGPGATLWGANAVNGVINVITRPAARTLGTLLSASAGNRAYEGVFRHGAALGSEGHLRIYGKASRTQNTRLTSGASVPDGWDFSQTGFRADWREFPLQGDAYSGRAEDRGSALGFTLARIEVTGMNVLGRWTRRLEGDGQFRLQAYVDQAKREDPVLFQPDSSIFDLEFQHGLSPRGAHRVLWGGGYRRARDFVQDGLLAGMRPQGRALEWANLFVQDEIRLAEGLHLTPGVKLEHNDFTGLEHLPSARLAWTPSENRLLWAAVSRAVRAPSRFDRDVVVPLLPGFSLGGPNFQSEVAHVYELGYRAGARGLSWSATLFRHEWERLRSGTPPPLTIENMIEGPVYGLETWAAWQPASRWKLSGGLTTLRKKLRLEPGSTDPLGPNNVTLANDPEFQWSLRSSLDLGAGQELGVTVRRVGRLQVQPVEAYTAFNLRYGWRIRRDLELYAVAENAFDPGHAEFRSSAAQPSEIERSLFLGARWTL
jgi:iron complex outermembrane receptor protein